jgi:hypothetical protein
VSHLVAGAANDNAALRVIRRKGDGAVVGIVTLATSLGSASLLGAIRCELRRPERMAAERARALQAG